MDTLGMTSRWVAAARELESARPDALFRDPLAGALAGQEGRAMLAEMAAVSGPPGAMSPENPYLAIRTRYFDDVLLAAARGGSTQVVILAAGMDARAFRLEWPTGTEVFEVERPEVLAYKEAVLTKAGATPKAARRVIAADLREDFGSSLRAAGFDSSRQAMFLIEGLLPYLPDAGAAHAILAKVHAIAAEGSSIAMDIVSQTFLQSPYTAGLRDRLKALQAPWEFGTDDPEGFLAAIGWQVTEVAEPGEVSHGRWPYPVVPRSVPGVPRTYLVTARR